MRRASKGMEPIPAKGSTTRGGPSGWAAATSFRAASTNDRLWAFSQSAKWPMKSRSARRRASGSERSRPVNARSASRAACRKGSGQAGSAGSGRRVAMSTARHAASGRVAHQTCRVCRCPLRTFWSRRECSEITPMGISSVSIRRRTDGVSFIFSSSQIPVPDTVTIGRLKSFSLGTSCRVSVSADTLSSASQKHSAKATAAVTGFPLCEHCRFRRPTGMRISGQAGATGFSPPAAGSGENQAGPLPERHPGAHRARRPDQRKRL
jgi:hypothetical protein